MKDSSIPTILKLKDAEKRKHIYDHSQGSPSKRQNTQFKITRQFWVGKSRSDEQQHHIPTNLSAAKPSSVHEKLQIGGLSFNEAEIIHETGVAGTQDQYSQGIVGSSSG